ncbi:MAG: glycosyltransferase [Calothrix sp. MO_167.B42]|nr:glycosyltransferase [Calothrix sp. MO_167.B42]
MILMTLGTIPFPFDRAILWLRILLNSKIINEPVFLQYGNSNISFIKNHPLVTLEPTITSHDWNKLVDESRLVISHAGQGSTRMLAARGARFLLLPRLKSFGEHIDNHQLLFAQSLAQFGIDHFVALDRLEKAILNPPPAFQGKLFETPKLTDYLLSQYPPEKIMTQLIA